MSGGWLRRSPHAEFAECAEPKEIGSSLRSLRALREDFPRRPFPVTANLRRREKPGDFRESWRLAALGRVWPSKTARQITQGFFSTCFLDFSSRVFC